MMHYIPGYSLRELMSGDFGKAKGNSSRDMITFRSHSEDGETPRMRECLLQADIRSIHKGSCNHAPGADRCSREGQPLHRVR